MAKIKISKTVHKIERVGKNIVVTHPDNKESKPKINLTKKANAKTIEAGVKASKAYHKKYPHKGYK